MRKISMWVICLLITIAMIAPNKLLMAQTVRIGALFPISGPGAMYGQWSNNALEIARDMINERGGLWGKKIEIVKGDAVDPKAAISEATRLITNEKIQLITGTNRSPLSVPASEVANRNKVIYWEGSCEADRITGRNLDYVFRPFVRSSTKAIPIVDYCEKVVAPALKKDPKDLRIAIAFDQGDAGVDSSNAFIDLAKKHGLKIVIALPHDGSSLDFSSDVMRLKATRADFLYFATYLDTTAVFWRQARDLDFNIPGGCCGTGAVDGLHNILKGPEVDYWLDCEGPSIIGTSFLSEKSRSNISELRSRYRAKYKDEVPYIAILTFGHAMILFEDVLPRAGSLDPEVVRKAAMATDIPEGGTIFGYGVKFYPPGHPQQGQNERVFAVLTQYQNRKMVTVWPQKVQVSKAWCPVPSWAERAAKK